MPCRQPATYFCSFTFRLMAAHFLFTTGPKSSSLTATNDLRINELKKSATPRTGTIELAETFRAGKYSNRSGI